MASTPQTPQHFILHVFPFSLYSIMTRLSIALGQTAYPQSVKSMDVQLRLVNLHRDENISEEYLSTVNPKGQIPALTGASLSEPLTDSLDILYFLCRQFFPCLLGGPREPAVTSLLSKLHNIQALSLSVAPEDCTDVLPCPAVNALLADPTTSTAYRKALEFKKSFHEATQAAALQKQSIQQAKEQTKDFFADIVDILSTSDETTPPWIFGSDVGPTVLDAHCVSFIARLLDCGHFDLVPDCLQAYAQRVMGLPEWKTVTNGRSTMWDVSMGHVHLLNPI